MRAKAVFLDRDGVLNQAIVRDGKPYPPANVDELVIPAEVLPALLTLKQKGYLLIGASNQPDVARGTTSIETILTINQRLMHALPLDDLRICVHDDDVQCLCRKPKPGLLLQAAADYDIDLSQSLMVGDRWRDIEAGIQAGCATVWIDYGYNEKKAVAPSHTVNTLTQACNWIAQRK